jgi:excisionase family DNA binding protein
MSSSNQSTPLYVSTKQLARNLGLSYRTLEDWRRRRVGPPFVRVGGLVRYPVSLLDEYLQSRTVVETA